MLAALRVDVDHQPQVREGPARQRVLDDGTLLDLLGILLPDVLHLEHLVVIADQPGLELCGGRLDGKIADKELLVRHVLIIGVGEEALARLREHCKQPLGVLEHAGGDQARGLRAHVSQRRPAAHAEQPPALRVLEHGPPHLAHLG